MVLRGEGISLDIDGSGKYDVDEKGMVKCH